MRHRPDLSPTARLILFAVKYATGPLTRAQLVEATGCSLFTIGNTTQNMVKRDLLVRRRISGLNYFSLPVADTAANTAYPVISTSEVV